MFEIFWGRFGVHVLEVFRGGIWEVSWKASIRKQKPI